MHRLIYEELHIKVGHAGPERVYQLAKERMFWPGMEKDIIHFFIRLCSCDKNKPPHIKPVAPLGIITITHPMLSN